MKTLTFIFLFISLTAFGQTDSLHSLNGTWNLKMFKNLITGKIKDTARLQDNWAVFYTHVKLTFHDSAGHGTIIGKSFCNDVGDHYTLLDKNKIAALGLGSTAVNCRLEQELEEGIKNASSYRRTKDSLFILYNQDSEEMIFVKYKEK